MTLWPLLCGIPRSVPSQAHEADKRDYIYTRDQLEWAKTHDELWNAAQNELVYVGKMHGFMR